MTREEAIEMLNAKIECIAHEISELDIKCNNNNCVSCDLCYRQGSFKEQMEYLDMAIEALKEPEREYTHIGLNMSERTISNVRAVNFLFLIKRLCCITEQEYIIIVRRVARLWMRWNNDKRRNNIKVKGAE